MPWVIMITRCCGKVVLVVNLKVHIVKYCELDKREYRSRLISFILFIFFASSFVQDTSIEYVV
jgi:hypothetical protein